jgi:hypothetical protein
MRQDAVHNKSEEEYFHQLDAELIEQMRRCAASEEWHRRMAEAFQIGDRKVHETLRRLGYEPTSAPLLRLAPLIQVAWSDGTMSPAERECISAIASLHEVREKSPAFPQFLSWLTRRPSDEFFLGTLEILREILASMPPEQRTVCRSAVIDGCKKVASAGCAIFGWSSRICKAKKKLIAEIERKLGTACGTAPPGEPGPSGGAG